MRPEFEVIVKGWSPDNFMDLGDRITRMVAWMKDNPPIPQQELIVMGIMIRSYYASQMLKEMHG